MDMDSVAAAFWVVVSGFIAALLLFAWKRFNGEAFKSRSRRPPGPKPLPVIGNLHQLLARPPHLALMDLSRRFGPLMFLRLGCIPALVASSAETAKEFLQTHDLVFASRPKYAVAEHFTYKFLDIMWAPYGQHWRDLRKVCALELFTTKRVDSFERVRAEEVSWAVSSILESVSKHPTVNLRKVLSDTTLSVILRMATSRKLGGENKVLNAEEKNAKESIEGAVELCGALNVGDYLPYLKWLDLQGYGRHAKKLHKVQDSFFQLVIDDRRKEHGNRGENEDLLDVLLSLQKGSGMTDDTIKAVIQDVVAAGSDTAWVTCEWTMAELLRNPGTMAKAQNELDEIVGRGRNVVESDLPSLKFLHAIVKEVLRLHPASPLILYESTLPCTSNNGYIIPRGTRLLVNVYAIGRDPRTWERPLDFWPERFEGSSIDLRGQNFELIPFGSGRRICPGMTLGLRMVHYILARMLHGFNWALPATIQKHEDVDMQERFGLAMPKLLPLDAAPSPRLPLHLY